MTAVFLAGGVVILNFPTTGPRLRVGDIARQNYRARLAFRVPDAEATRRARDNAEASTPWVFRENAGHLERIPRQSKRFLLEVVEARNIDDLAPVARSKWGINRQQLRWLRPKLERDWIETTTDVVEDALAKAGKLGIMDSSVRQRELDSDLYEIVVRSEGDDTDQTRWSVALTLGYPGALREFLADKLQAVLGDKPASFREAFLDLITHAATPTLKLDTEATAEAQRAARKGAAERYRLRTKGSVILAEGERATAEAIREIREEERAFESQASMVRDREGEGEALRRWLLGAVGVTGLFLAAFTLLALYAMNFASDVLRSNTRLFGVYTVCLATLASVRALEQFGVTRHWTPIVLAAMILAVTTGPMLAFGTTAFLAIMAGVAANGGMALAVPLLVGGFAAVLGLRRIRRRTDLVEAGLTAGLVQFTIIWAVHLAGLRTAGPAAAWPVYESLAGWGCGLLGGSVLAGTLPYVERFFDVATELRLLEWTDQNQPLLRKLALEAPGTYHHSTIVSNMAEAAAEEIRVNALLARAGGYLHDVGKLNRPDYFVENMGGSPSRHEKLSPVLSALILTAHTKDGVELAARYGVPSPLRRIIAEHHGTSVAEFFYNKAMTDAAQSGASVRQSMFRYRGPKPRSPESAIVMLADSVESAARSLDHVSASRIERLVHDIVKKRLEDGQLDECGMSITDIRHVEKSLVRSLVAISHPRIRYPAP